MTKVHRGTVPLCIFLKRNNMKKTYLKPAWQVVELKQQGCLLAGSKHGADYKVGGLGEGADKLFNFDGDDIEDTDVDR